MLLYATWHIESMWTLKQTKFDFDYQIGIEKTNEIGWY